MRTAKQDHRRQAAHEPSEGQAHGPEAGQRQRCRHRRAQPDVHLIADHPLTLAEVALQQPGRDDGEPVDHDDEGERPDHSRRRRRSHRGGVRRCPGRTAGVERNAGDHGDGRDRRRDLARLPRPAGDGQAHPEVVEIRQDIQGHRGDRVGPERVWPQQAREHDPNPDRAQLGHHAVGKTPPEGRACLAHQAPPAPGARLRPCLAC